MSGVSHSPHMRWRAHRPRSISCLNCFCDRLKGGCRSAGVPCLISCPAAGRVRPRHRAMRWVTQSHLPLPLLISLLWDNPLWWALLSRLPLWPYCEGCGGEISSEPLVLSHKARSSRFYTRDPESHVCTFLSRHFYCTFLPFACFHGWLGEGRCLYHFLCLFFIDVRQTCSAGERLLLLLLNFGCVYIKSNIIFYLMVI